MEGSPEVIFSECPTIILALWKVLVGWSMDKVMRRVLNQWVAVLSAPGPISNKWMRIENNFNGAVFFQYINFCFSTIPWGCSLRCNVTISFFTIIIYHIKLPHLNLYLNVEQTLFYCRAVHFIKTVAIQSISSYRGYNSVWRCIAILYAWQCFAIYFFFFFFGNVSVLRAHQICI